MKEFNLSNKSESKDIETDWLSDGTPKEWKRVICYLEEDVKEFIKRLKESFGKGSHKYFTPRSINQHIDKLAGEKLR